MELPNSAYLYNLSLLGITYSAVSALVMLLRQSMGGKLSNFDIYLIRAYVSFGFIIAFDAVLPPLGALLGLAPPLLWPLASSLAAIVTALNLFATVRNRLHASREPISPIVLTSYGFHGLVVVLLAVDAAVPSVQGSGLFAAALTLCLGNMMWVFVRRIVSLLGATPGEDWDPRRG